jgi:hypothetical protein
VPHVHVATQNTEVGSLPHRGRQCCCDWMHTLAQVRHRARPGVVLPVCCKENRSSCTVCKLLWRKKFFTFARNKFRTHIFFGGGAHTPRLSRRFAVYRSKMNNLSPPEPIVKSCWSSQWSLALPFPEKKAFQKGRRGGTLQTKT